MHALLKTSVFSSYSTKPIEWLVLLLLSCIMAVSTKKVACSLVIFGVTLPISYYVYRKWKKYQLNKYIDTIKTYDSINSQTIYVKDQETIKEALGLAEKYKFLAIDAEWVQKGNFHIALLQISFPNGKCYLISHQQELPLEFLEMLENGDILKATFST